MDHSTYSAYTKSRELFDILAQATSQQLLRGSLTESKVQDELDRFKIWGGNLGAGHLPSNKISLDWRLRNAIELKEEIIQLLEEIAFAFKDLHEIVSGTREDQITTVDQEDDRDGAVTISEAVELFGIVSDSITGLFRLSLIIQKASPRDRFMRALTNVQEPFDPIYDIYHVGAKFPKLERDNKLLLQKLATAITQRRQFFRYSREHQERKAKPKVESSIKTQTKTDHSNKLHADVLSEKHPESLVQTQASTLVVDGLDTVRFNIDEVDDSLSQASFATSVDENTNKNRLRVPRLEDINGKSREFECPYCCAIIAPRNQRQWKKHVFEDLRPYSCTSEECDVKLFMDRRTWFDHELSKHHCLYKCLYCQSQAFQSAQELYKHISERHNKMATLTMQDGLLEATKERPQHFAAAECPFCDAWNLNLRALNPHISSDEAIFVSPQQFRNHVAVHMEQLALFALPRHRDDEDENERSSGVNAGTIHSSSDNAVQSEQARSSDQVYALVNNDYTVALISYDVRTAQVAGYMLDERHPMLPVASSDTNRYDLGQIGHHNIVMATLKPDTVNQRTSMDYLLQAFPKLRFGFLIYTGSSIPGTPNEDPQLDLHIGDVVVINEDLSSIRKYEDDKKRKKALPLVVRHALTSISTQIENQGRRLQLFIEPTLRSRRFYGYPEEDDLLFAANLEKYKSFLSLQDNQLPQLDFVEMNSISYPISIGHSIFPCDNCQAEQTACHISSAGCRTCKKDGIACTRGNGSIYQVKRKIREDSTVPTVHHGVIIERKELSLGEERLTKLHQDGGILCIENGATVWSSDLPCLTVWGVTDYGFNLLDDEHIDWYPYALPAAIAYAFHILDWIQEPLDHRNADWQVQKQRIESLYNSGYSIPEIRDKMKTGNGFDATAFQYQRQITAWRLTRPDVTTSRYINQPDQLAKTFFGEKGIPGPGITTDGKIKCVCFIPELDDGFTILCESCDTWQHVECYYYSEDIPSDDDTHYCIDCEPRYIDIDRADTIQRWKQQQHIRRRESKAES